MCIRDRIKWGTYEITIDSLAHSGKKSGKITSNEAGNSFGGIAYKIPANYNGSKIKLEGFMKIKNVKNGFAGLILSVDGNERSLAFDNMQNQNISGTKDWGKYSITPVSYTHLDVYKRQRDNKENNLPQKPALPTIPLPAKLIILISAIDEIPFIGNNDGFAPWRI